MEKSLVAIVLSAIILMAGCIGKQKEETKTQEANISDLIDISNAIFSNQNSSCGAYVGNYFANAVDMSSGETLTSYVNITIDNSSCTIYNGIPNQLCNKWFVCHKDFAVWNHLISITPN